MSGTNLSLDFVPHSPSERNCEIYSIRPHLFLLAILWSYLEDGIFRSTRLSGKPILTLSTISLSAVDIVTDLPRKQPSTNMTPRTYGSIGTGRACKSMGLGASTMNANLPDGLASFLFISRVSITL